MTELNIISHVIGSGESRNFITKSVLGSFCKTAALLLAVSFGVVSPHASWAQGKPEDTGKEEAPRVKRERKAPQKPEKTTINSHAQHNVIVVKFQEGTHIRQRQGILMAESQKRSPEEKTKLQKAKLDDAKITAQLNKLDNLLQKHPRHGVRRLFSREEADLDRERDEGSPNSDEELADLNLYFHVVLDDVQAEESAALIDELNALDIIEIAYPAPIGEDSAADLWPTTGNYVGYQGYRNAAPNGIDANYAWSFAGGRGDGVKVIDIEQNWNLYHEDLNGVFHYSGTPSGDTKHGTAVLGVVAAAENSYGMSGITPRVWTGVSSAYRTDDYFFFTITYYDLADAVNRASGALAYGDIILIEQHAKGPSSGLACDAAGCGNCGQFEYVAMEYWQANYDAIRNATARGQIVVEAAGNGAMNLDSSVYGGAFNRSVRDSGAILVGAGAANTRVPKCWSNYGSRVDVEGWGDSVATLSYGDLAMLNGSDDRQWYTSSFSGTSSASPIVVGAAASVQGMRKARYLPALNSYQMRRVLSQTGTSQASSTHNIGPLPNLRSAFIAHGSYDYIYPNTYVNWVYGLVAPQGYHDYYFYTSGSRYFQFSTCYYSDFDTVLEVYNPSGTMIAVNDDSCGLQSQVTAWAATAGWYRVRVRGYSSSNGYFWMSHRML